MCCQCRSVWTVSISAASPKNLSGAKGVAVLLGVTLSEILIWITWRWGAQFGGHFLAGLYLLIVMQIEHSVEMGILKRTKPFAYIMNVRTFVFTLMEVLGGVGWLYFTTKGQPYLGGACLGIGLSIEHILQGSQLRPAKIPPPPEAIS